MVEVTSRLIFLVVFTIGLAAFIFWDRNKVQRHFILFYRRTTKGIELIDRIAKKAPKLWSYYGWAGVVTAFISIIVGSAVFIYSIGRMITTQSTREGPSLIMPGLVSENQFQAGVSFIPVEYWVIGIGVLMVVHEMSHGIVARAEDFELNSVGWVVFGILPGAFVEPKGENMLPGGDVENEDSDHGMWEQGNWKSRLKVLGAGSFANYLTGGLILLLALGVTSAVTTSTGVMYEAQDGYPAQEVGMTNGTLEMINGEEINNLEDLQRVSDSIQVNDSVHIVSSEGEFNLTAVEHPESDGGYIGVLIGASTVLQEPYDQYQAGIEWFISLLWTVAMLNILIGLFNMMPIKPLDGGLMFETVTKQFAEDKLHIVNTLSLVGWTVILGSMLISIAATAL